MAELYLFNNNGEYYSIAPGLIDRVFAARTYKATIVSRSAIALTDNFAKSPITFKFPRDNFFAKGLIQYMPEQPITVEVFKDGAPYWRGRVINVSRVNNVYIEVSCESIFAAQRNAGTNIRIMEQCWHTLYSEGCGVIQELWQVSFPDTVVSGSSVSLPTMAEPSGYFNNGKATINNQVRTILKHEGTDIYFSSPFNGTQTGLLQLYPGCKLTSENCKAFSNLNNFLGFEYIADKNPFSSTGLL